MTSRKADVKQDASNPDSNPDATSDIKVEETTVDGDAVDAREDFDVSWSDVPFDDADDNDVNVTRGEFRLWLSQYGTLFDYHRNR